MKVGLIFFFFFTCYLCKAIVHFTNLDMMVVPKVIFIASSLYDIYNEKKSLGLKISHLLAASQAKFSLPGKGEAGVGVFLRMDAELVSMCATKK